MAVVGLFVGVVAEGRRNPVVKDTRYCLSVDNEQADVGRDGRTCIARPNSQARTGRG